MSHGQGPLLVVMDNFESLVVGVGLAGFGFVVGDHEDSVLADASVAPIDVISLVVAEALSFWWVSSMALYICFRNVCFGTDYLQLFELWMSASYLGMVVRDWSVLSLCFDSSFLYSKEASP